MEETQKNNPLHGKTLEYILHYLLMTYTWEELDELVRINCFHSNPSLKIEPKIFAKNGLGP